MMRYSWLPDLLRRQREEPSVEQLTGGIVVSHERARPGQAHDAARFLYAPPGVVDSDRLLAVHAVSVWVNMAVSKIASSAPGGQMRIHARNDRSSERDDHPLLELIGEYGVPNDAQDRVEFFEETIAHYDLAGNAYWYWFSKGGGAPSEVYTLNPQYVRVIPGRSRTVDGYIYRAFGHEYRLSREEVTHFRRLNPRDSYYGLSAIRALMVDVETDVNMAIWNRDFFGPSVGLPAGIMVVPAETSDAEMARLEKEFAARYGSERRTALVRAAPGAAAWFDGGLKHHDLDFGDGRMLSRKAVMNTLDLPEGLYSETSTEAHARVAERQFWGSVQRRLDRIATKLNSDALPFWPGHRDLAVSFADLRQRFADWEQEQKKVDTLLRVFTVDEVRAREFHVGPRPKEQEDVGSQIPAAASDQPSSGGRDSDSVQREGQVSDMVGSEQ